MIFFLIILLAVLIALLFIKSKHIGGTQQTIKCSPALKPTIDLFNLEHVIINYMDSEKVIDCTTPFCRTFGANDITNDQILIPQILCIYDQTNNTLISIRVQSKVDNMPKEITELFVAWLDNYIKILTNINPGLKPDKKVKYNCSVSNFDYTVYMVNRAYSDGKFNILHFINNDFELKILGRYDEYTWIVNWVHAFIMIFKDNKNIPAIMTAYAAYALYIYLINNIPNFEQVPLNLCGILNVRTSTQLSLAVDKIVIDNGLMLTSDSVKKSITDLKNSFQQEQEQVANILEKIILIDEPTRNLFSKIVECYISKLENSQLEHGFTRITLALHINKYPLARYYFLNRNDNPNIISFIKEMKYPIDENEHQEFNNATPKITKEPTVGWYTDKFTGLHINISSLYPSYLIPLARPMGTVRANVFDLSIIRLIYKTLNISTLPTLIDYIEDNLIDKLHVQKEFLNIINNISNCLNLMEDLYITKNPDRKLNYITNYKNVSVRCGVVFDEEYEDAILFPKIYDITITNNEIDIDYNIIENKLKNGDVQIHNCWISIMNSLKKLNKNNDVKFIRVFNHFVSLLYNVCIYMRSDFIYTERMYFSTELMKNSSPKYNIHKNSYILHGGKQFINIEEIILPALLYVINDEIVLEPISSQLNQRIKKYA